MKKLIFLMLFSISLQAAVPTMEGLFRNGENKDLGGNFIILKMMVEEQGLSDDLEKKISYLKFYFSVKENNQIEFLQIHFPDGEMKKNSATHLYYAHDLMWNLKKEKEGEKILFYSIIAMVGLNDSRPISYYLKKQSGEYKTNKNVMNQEKIKLLKKYKDYLITKKEDKESIAISPLSPEDEEQKAEVKKILAAPLYVQGENIILIRKENQFFWQLKLSNVHALFSNDTHFIRELTVQTVKGPMVGIFGEFHAFNGSHSLPKEILIKDRQDKSYKIKMLSYKAFNDPKKGIKERHRDFKEAVDKYDATLAGDMEVQKIESSFPNTFLYL
ncbi:MAG: hypothetical protein DRQ88_02650 [Epsilonproteobacteria bacterium]|nr:MAG: hypothetical protein DRQ89_02205 [Campylobacterota bacterium]RLA67567.1 MAG: hypothetical protein DRQ88_02650 [Campylobacterota bacterium]